MENKMNKNLGYRDAYMDKDAGIKDFWAKNVAGPLKTMRPPKPPAITHSAPHLKGAPTPAGARPTLTPQMGKTVAPAGGASPLKVKTSGPAATRPPRQAGAKIPFESGKGTPIDVSGGKGLKTPMSTGKKIGLTGAVAAAPLVGMAGQSAVEEASGLYDKYEQLKNTSPEEIDKMQGYKAMAEKNPWINTVMDKLVAGDREGAFQAALEANPEMANKMGAAGIKKMLGGLWEKYGTMIKWGGGALGAIMLISMLGGGGGGGRRQPQKPYGIGHAWR